MGIGDWGLGIWGLGIGDWPIPNPHDTTKESLINIKLYYYFILIIILYKKFLIN